LDIISFAARFLETHTFTYPKLDSPSSTRIIIEKMRFSTFITLAAAPLLALAAPQQQEVQDAPLITAAPESQSTASLPTQTVAPGEAWNAEAENVVLE
ncbi:hypothetical protein KCU80_g7103, partial [Aureobasidium melanogenum]